MQSASYWDIEVFFDGDCPLCRREIAALRKMDRRGRIRFTDIAASDFEPSRYGIDLATLMARMHARLPDGTLDRRCRSIPANLCRGRSWLVDSTHSNAGSLAGIGLGILGVRQESLEVDRPLPARWQLPCGATAEWRGRFLICGARFA